MSSQHIAISCGGTGGHTLPGLATARALADAGHRVTLVLTTRDTDRTTAAAWTGPHLILPADYLTPRHPLRSLRALRTLLASRAAAIRAFRADPPTAVLAMGSYASYPAVSAAVALRIPLILHESNVIPGRLVARYAPKAAAVAAGFPQLRDHLPASHTPVIPVGTPIRPELVQAAQKLLSSAPPSAPSAPPRILVTGGSQGARSLNTAAAHAFIRLAREGVPFTAVHLTGQTDHDRVAALYAAATPRPPVETHPYSADMATHYAAATFALTRAGASTLAELIAFRLPALLVPYPLAAKNHQMANARAAAASGAFDLLPDASLTPDALYAYLLPLLTTPDKTTSMRAAFAHSLIPSPFDAPSLLASLLLSPPSKLKG